MRATHPFLFLFLFMGQALIDRFSPLKTKLVLKLKENLTMLARHELDEASKLLLAAADLMEKVGHTKFTRKNANGYCALGAIGAAMGDLPWKWFGNEPVVARLASHLPNSFTDAQGVEHTFETPEWAVTYWNNERERKPEEVIAKFREVAYDPQYAAVPA